jgi:hypothetical protein
LRNHGGGENHYYNFELLCVNSDIYTHKTDNDNIQGQMITIYDVFKKTYFLKNDIKAY